MAMTAKILLIVVGVFGALGGMAKITPGEQNGGVYMIAAVLACGTLLYFSRAERE
jgi:hypothetical protein